MTYPQRYAAGGYVYVKRRARKGYPCQIGDGPILPGDEYYAVTIGGGGLSSLKFPDRVHLRCAGARALRYEGERVNNH